MSITEVEVKTSNNKIPLIRNGDEYSGQIDAPKVASNYELEISAHDDAGNVTTANSLQFPMLNLEVTKWSTPKTNWLANFRFNIQDYNRIKNNIEFLHELASSLNIPFNIEEMGADKLSYLDYFYANEFNLFEENLEIINKYIFSQPIGDKKEFFDNAPFIDYVELNRIESACLTIYNLLYTQKKNKQRLQFSLGRYKGVKI